jgi:hypothetical protein
MYAPHSEMFYEAFWNEILVCYVLRSFRHWKVERPSYV